MKILRLLLVLSVSFVIHLIPAEALSFEPHEPHHQISFNPKRDQVRKLDSSLKQIIEQWQRQPGSLRFTPRARIKNDRVQVTIFLERMHAADLQKLQNLGFQIQHILKRYNRVQGWMPLAHLSELENLNHVKRVQLPSYAVFNQGSVLTEGDEVLRTDVVRNIAGVTGQGVRIGVLSDGADGVFDSVTSLDLPDGNDTSCDPSATQTSGVHCESFSDSGIANGAEGTAMLEILHDMAPQAELYFANVDTSDDFIMALDYFSASESDGGAEVDIIVDDLSFLSEPFFEDGDVATRVQDLLDDGILYVTSAGNEAQSHLQEDYQDSDGDGWHEFATGYESYGVVIGASRTFVAALQWDDEFDHPTSNLNLYLDVYDTAGTYLTSVESELNNVGSIWPALEAVQINNLGGEVIGYFFIHRSEGTDADVNLELITHGSTLNEYYDVADSIFGHAAVDGVLSIGAVDQNDENNDEIEYFSSQGPVTVSGEQRDKPDLVASDGVTVTGYGGFSTPFYGTSAAAPHVAGCLALLLEADSSLSAAELKDVLQSTAVDLGDENYDWIYGHGHVDCAQAVSAITGAVIPEPESEPEPDLSEETDDLNDNDLASTEVENNEDSTSSSFDLPNNPTEDSGAVTNSATAASAGGCSLQTAVHLGFASEFEIILATLFLALILKIKLGFSESTQ